MKLKAPPGTTHVQTPSKVYELRDGHIHVDPDNKRDLDFFLANGFTKETNQPQTPKPQTPKGENNGTAI
jgi:hypothetical protein